MGLGRENITGVLPLFLTKEPWEIARRRGPPIYGLMCTADVMGFASSQTLTVPFRVLIKAIEDYAEEPTESKQRIVNLVLDTCKNIVGAQNEFRKNLIAQIQGFLKSPEKRTSDVVSSIQIFLSQIYSLINLENV